MLSVLLTSVNTYKNLMKEFPLNELLTAAEMEHLSAAITHIFAHLKKGSKSSGYPIPRYLRLLEAIFRDLSTKALAILQRKRLMHLDYDDFDKVTSECRKVFTVWEDQFGQFREVLRELAKKRNQEKLPLKVNIESRPPLQERIASIRKFRCARFSFLLVNTVFLTFMVFFQASTQRVEISCDSSTSFRNGCGCIFHCPCRWCCVCARWWSSARWRSIFY